MRFHLKNIFLISLCLVIFIYLLVYFQYFRNRNHLNRSLTFHPDRHQRIADICPKLPTIDEDPDGVFQNISWSNFVSTIPVLRRDNYNIKIPHELQILHLSHPLEVTYCP